jgi:hypothetical protein
MTNLRLFHRNRRQKSKKSSYDLREKPRSVMWLEESYVVKKHVSGMGKAAESILNLWAKNNLTAIYEPIVKVMWDP